MHRFAIVFPIACRRTVRLLTVTFLLWGPIVARATERTAPVWLVSNGFHTSFAFRVKDLNFADELEDNRQAKILLIGWGAGDFYRGHVNPWTFIEAFVGIGPSILHIVPVRGRISDRFRHSDVVALSLPVSKLKILIGAINRSFARGPMMSYIYEGRGYYQNSRFYRGRQRFYFPYMCNTWVAINLRRSGIPIFLPTAIVAGNLIHEAAEYGHTVQHRSKPADAF